MMPWHSTFFKDEIMQGVQVCPHSADKNIMVAIESIMAHEVLCINMDITLRDAIELCSQNRIRHLPVLDENKRLVGLVTDRDLRYSISPRIGTISENNSDRETLKFHVHRIMKREVITASAEAPLAEAAQLMLTHRIGCLPVVDSERHVIGIVTTADLLRYLANQ
jgi:acetoin utilization protein AcuB